jgi:hypothetical protein
VLRAAKGPMCWRQKSWSCSPARRQALRLSLPKTDSLRPYKSHRKESPAVAGL